MSLVDVQVRLRIANDSGAFAAWSAERLGWFFTPGRSWWWSTVLVSTDEITGRPEVSPSGPWPTVREWQTLRQTPLSPAWSPGLARDWERLACRVEAMARPYPLDIVEGTAVPRLEGLARLGSIASWGRRTVRWDRA